jgi:hypothetical protein
MRITGLVFLISCTVCLSVASAQTPDHDARAIREVIENAYVAGVFIDRNESAVRAGFHPAFVLSVYDADTVIVAPLDMWLDLLPLNGEQSTDSVRHVFEYVDVTSSTATVKLQLWINDEHIYTDYLGLYRFADGWKIVTKVFASHD